MSIPLEEISQRWERIRQAMGRGDLAGVLVFANQLKTAALHYVSHYALLGERAFCWLPAAGQPVLFLSEAWDLDRASRESPIRDVRALGKDWPQEIASACEHPSGRLGLAGREIMGRSDVAALEQALGKETVPASRLLEDIATLKSQYERDRIRDASAMADAGFLRALEVMRPGLKDYELVAEIDYVMRRMGATDNFQMLAAGKHNTGMLLPVGKALEPGDLILFEITPANGSETYSAQLCRTVILGEDPSEVVSAKFELLREALEESLAVVRPGSKVRDVAGIQNAILEKAGYAEYCQPPYMRARGHGFGLGRIEIDDDCPLDFAEGMSLVVHPNQYLPETGYLALGEHVIVGSDGVERLTRTDSRIYTVP